MEAVVAELGWDEVMERYHDEVLGPFHPRVGATVFHRELSAALTAAAGRTGRPVRVLDAGCGPGNLVDVLAGWGVPVDLVGVDGSAPGLRIAEARAAAAGLPAAFHRADLTELRLPEQFDVIVSVNSVLPVRAAREPRRDVGRILTAFAAHLAGPHARLVAVLPAFDAATAEADSRAGHDAAGGDPAAHRRRIDRQMRLDRQLRLADNGFGVPHCLHDPTTIAAELPAAGLRVLTGPTRLPYPRQVAAAHCSSGQSWDWVLTAARA